MQFLAGKITILLTLQLCLWQCSVNLADLIPTTVKTEDAVDVKPKKKKAKESDELEDDEYELDTEKVFEKTSEELEKEIANAEFIEGANEVSLVFFYMYL